jgi:hypothetical protein
MLAVTDTSQQFAKAISAFRNVEAKVTDSAIAFTGNGSFSAAEEPQREHAPGSISLCGATMVIEVRKTNTFERCPVIGQIGPGADVIRAISAAGAATLLRAEVFSPPELNDLKLAPAKTIASK